MSFTNRLKEITQFNPTLIYGLKPQKSVKSLGIANDLLHGVNQIEDMLQAYHYAQETILATIEKNGIASITSEQVLEWLNQLHLRAAKTLASDYKTKAGEYAKLQAFRWNSSNSVQIILFSYLLGRFDTQEKIDKFLSSNLLEEVIQKEVVVTLKKNSSSQGAISPKTFVLSILEAMKINKKDASILVALLESAHQDKTIEIPKDQLQILALDSEEFKPAIIALVKLAQLYHNYQLTPTQKLAVNNVVKICIPPSKYTETMKSFADNLVNAWKSCDKNDLDKVVTLAADFFYNIIEIHPYFNGNVRLATCFMNVILRSLGRPSIVMRYLDKKQDDSSCSQAFTSIIFNYELLFQHIKMGINETVKNGHYSCDSQLSVINARFEAGFYIREIICSFPKYDIENILNELLQSIPVLLERKNIFPHEGDKYLSAVLNRLAVFLMAELNELKKQKESKSTHLISVPEVVQRTYTVEKVKLILNKLDTLTGHKGWKSYHDGSKILLTAENDAIASELVIALNKTDALKAEFKRNMATKAPVVYLTLINLEKLDLIKSLNVANESKLEIETPKPKY